MKIKVVKKYVCRSVVYEPNTVIEVTEAEGQHLFNDAPGCFKVLKEKEVDAPPSDKMVHDHETKTK